MSTNQKRFWKISLPLIVTVSAGLLPMLALAEDAALPPRALPKVTVTPKPTAVPKVDVAVEESQNLKLAEAKNLFFDLLVKTSKSTEKPILDRNTFELKGVTFPECVKDKNGKNLVAIHTDSKFDGYNGFRIETYPSVLQCVADMKAKFPKCHRGCKRIEDLFHDDAKLTVGNDDQIQVGLIHPDMGVVGCHIVEGEREIKPGCTEASVYTQIGEGKINHASQAKIDQINADKKLADIKILKARICGSTLTKAEREAAARELDALQDNTNLGKIAEYIKKDDAEIQRKARLEELQDIADAGCATMTPQKIGDEIMSRAKSKTPDYLRKWADIMTSVITNCVLEHDSSDDKDDIVASKSNFELAMKLMNQALGDDGKGGWSKFGLLNEPGEREEIRAGLRGARLASGKSYVQESAAKGYNSKQYRKASKEYEKLLKKDLKATCKGGDQLLCAAQTKGYNMQLAALEHEAIHAEQLSYNQKVAALNGMAQNPSAALLFDGKLGGDASGWNAYQPGTSPYYQQAQVIAGQQVGQVPGAATISGASQFRVDANGNFVPVAAEAQQVQAQNMGVQFPGVPSGGGVTIQGAAQARQPVPVMNAGTISNIMNSY